MLTRANWGRREIRDYRERNGECQGDLRIGSWGKSVVLVWWPSNRSCCKVPSGVSSKHRIHPIASALYRDFPVTPPDVVTVQHRTGGSKCSPLTLRATSITY